MAVNWDGDRIFDRSVQLAILAVAAYAAWNSPTLAPTPTPVMSMSLVTDIFSRYWMVGLLVIVTAINMAVTRRRPPRPKGPFLRGDFNIGSGTGTAVSSLTLRTAALSDFKKEYRLAVVIGLNDRQVDKYDDTRISKSPSFKITGEELEIVIPFQPPMMEALNSVIGAAATAAIGKPGFRGFKGGGKKKKKIEFNYQMSVWSESVLLPKGINPDEIHKLSDVQRLNGMVVSEEIREGRLTRIV